MRVCVCVCVYVCVCVCVCARESEKDSMYVCDNNTLLTAFRGCMNLHPLPLPPPVLFYLWASLLIYCDIVSNRPVTHAWVEVTEV